MNAISTHFLTSSERTERRKALVALQDVETRSAVDPGTRSPMDGAADARAITANIELEGGERFAIRPPQGYLR
jgi:hypothetical protein